MTLPVPIHRGRALLLGAAVAAAALLAAASGASAVVIQTGHGHFLGIAPRTAPAGLTPTIQALRVAPRSGASTGSSGAARAAGPSGSLPANPFKATFGTGFVDTGAYPPDQELGNSGGCSFTNTNLGPGDPTYTYCLTDAQVQAELERVIQANGLPSNDSAVYFVMLPAGVDECDGPNGESSSNGCADTDFCAYHSSVGVGSGPLYAVQPYADVTGCTSGESPNSNAPADDLLNVLSHEHNETITDPFGDTWITAQGDEVGDLCASPDKFGSATGGSPGAEHNQTIGAGSYWLQDEYADSDGANPAFDGCEQRPGATDDGVSSTTDPGPLLYQGGPVVGNHTTYTIYWAPSTYTFPTAYQTTIDGYLTNVGARTHTPTTTGGDVYDVAAQYGTLDQPTASFTAPDTARLNQPVTFDASGSGDPQGLTLTYNWDFGDGATATTSQPTVTHAYTQAGTHLVTLTVTDQFGDQSQPDTRSIHILIPPTATFSVPPGTLYSGRPIHFDGSGSSGPDAPVTAYSWSFGDGATDSVAAPNHTYAAPGVYTVSLTVTDANGQSGASSQVVTVDTPPTSTTARSATTGSLRATFARHGSARATLVAGHVVVLLGRAVSCPAGAGRCTTTVALTTRLAQRATRGHRARVRTATIGTATIVTAAGRTSVLSVRLSAGGARLLASRHRLTVTARIASTGSGLQKATSSLTFTISQPAVPRRRRA